MRLIKKILHKLTGLHYPQEYLCLALEQLKYPLYCYIADANNKAVRDITSEHLFVGYKPLIIAIPAEDAQALKIVFSRYAVSIGSLIAPKQVVAILDIEKLEQDPMPGEISFYKGVKGSHSFLGRLQKTAFALNNNLYNKRAGNVFLEGNLYDQVQIAYAIPRKICLITVGSNDQVNLFPTDLHGRWGDHYIISLRKEGKACKQVLESGKLLLSDMEVNAFKEVYALGKNHMKELADKSQFNFSELYSENYRLPVPVHALGYKELELGSSFECDIHRLLVFKIIKEKQVKKTANTLSHIHNVYATWRYRNSLDTTYYLNK